METEIAEVSPFDEVVELRILSFGDQPFRSAFLPPQISEGWEEE